ncbi:polysaccharide biosynthesis/export family protein [Sphingomonas sp. 37zxx]|uniref:polysaccharide biosynthesis/export family protein n=1 Tax=Sphingomonas sp. 37zxx TaxID=1550073 RepID=UPI00053BDC03|nr:polysaccharide biosynthesis/export family protein [Sphingomonas sp. 37zxx]
MKLSVSKRFATLLIMTATITACAQERRPALPASAMSAEGSVYRLGLGDKLRLTVFNEASLSGEYQVSGNGVVSVPLIGDVRAVGLTARELEAALTQRFAAGYLSDPKLAVEVYDFRPFFILGEIQRPGRYPTTENLTVLGAIATAGGYTYRANTKRIFLRRAGSDQEYEVDTATDVKIQPGDVLRVGERYF